MHFTEEDIKQIENKGLTPKEVKSQIELFKKGVPYTNIFEAATIGNGITQLNKANIGDAIAVFESRKETLCLLKFVPASGAATRMFKFLFKFVKEYNPEKESINSYINKNKLKDLMLFMIGLDKFPFYDQVCRHIISNNIKVNSLSENQLAYTFVHAMLDEDQLNLCNYPKGLLPFHKYKNDVISTAFEEHLFESVLYASKEEAAKIHFTISERFKGKFINEFKRIQEKIEILTNSKFDISYSYQHESTDTIAVTLKDEPFRNKDGSLLFRPSGHGALLKNLNELDADIIFIKNIDNVVVKKYKEVVAKYKKVLAGILIGFQEKIFQYLIDLENNQIIEGDLIKVAEFLTRELNVKISQDFEKYSNKYKIEYLRDKLNRPIRVCGMVKNEGEPGGGPFWVKNESGNLSLQIVESAQINLKDKNQKEILKNATHFNPVDIVCGIKNYKGEKFNLEDFVDKKAAFITMKTKVGKDLKALESPGLWNGSMAFWNTIFVEVPIMTFNPVKTVNDLLKSPHQLK
ncbi:DUF4301 family protein [Winogradskyella immobilis]|uniref:DUF4301 family protein n=1 Tax=Winogradskyella immobilis TaxID=2816852 RepID=A0ABS8EM57_9FLAO|nr:DUF4301 family protein [Winogradskyella immobilis]MCC1484291.1 DUF4301 family protein [Winogradskyella immobilis]MCG0016383.1 DUF4301 family protein [Winogradskyella immobilis]